MDVSRMPKEGDRFGNWIIERTLDRGGMGMVYQAYNPDLGKSEKVALKVLDPAVAEKSADFVKRFYQEAAIVFKTHCPNLVSIHDAGRDSTSGFYYIVMEFLGGGTLRDRMRKQGPMPWREALSIIRSVALALAAVAKRKSVHRDIKPENIMFTADGVVKLADFGIAKAAQEDPENMLKTMPAQVFGTPAYMSPEQVKDASSVDARADIWSLGVVLFEMLAGVRPYSSKNLVEVAAFLLSSRTFPDIRTFKAPVAHVPVQVPTAVTMDTQPTMATQATYAMPMPDGPDGTATPPTQESRLDVPDGVAELLARMCDKDLSKRIATSEDVVRAIDRLLGQATESGSQVTMASAPARSDLAADQEGDRRRRIIWIACAGLFLSLVALCVFVLLRKSSDPVVPGPELSATNVVLQGGSSVLPPVSNAVENITCAPSSAKVNVPIPEPQNAKPLSSKTPEPLPSDSFVFFRPQKGTVDDVLAELDNAIARKPIHLKVLLSAYAQRNDLSVVRFEQRLLNPAIERLRTSGIRFSLVPGSGKYGSAVQEAAKRFGCDLE